MTENPAVTLGTEIAKLARAGRLDDAIEKAEQAAAQFPRTRLPGKGGKTGPTFKQFADKLRALAAAQVTAEPEPVQVQAPAEPVAPVSEPEPVQVQVLRLVHDGVNPTSLFDVVQYSDAHKIIGKDGLGWRWWRPGKAFYLRASGGQAADMDKINEAVAKLQETGLYRVELEIATTGPDGKPLERKRTAAERQAWQKAYDTALNTLRWNLSIGRAACDCGTAGLTEQTGKIAKDGEGMPVGKCYTCAGLPMPETAVPVVDVAALLEIGAEPALRSTLTFPDSEQCPSCRQMIQVEQTARGRRFKLHDRPMSGRACRGVPGRPVVDVEPEPASQPVRKVLAQVGPKVQTSTVAAPAAAESEPESVVGAQWKFKLLDGANGRATARDLRSDLNARVVAQHGGSKHMEFEVRLDKKARTLVVTLERAPESAKRTIVSTQVKGVSLTVRGVAPTVGRV